ncbi:MAG: ShlB/FhaC/HecB family hemolysin secretion/activation protein [Methylobacterium sp.]|nr:ShlB/FhaC/HecB family hemolysin secretion/activation protein [Methylobacterium sp.]
MDGKLSGRYQPGRSSHALRDRRVQAFEGRNHLRSVLDPAANFVKMNTRYIFAILLGLGMSMACLLSRADNPGQNLPPSTDPGRMLRDMQKQITPPPETAVPRVILPEEPVPAAEPGAADLYFTLSRVTVEGMTLLSAQETDAIITPWLSKEIRVAQLGELARQITALYRSKGYLLASVQVPPQRIERDGQIRLIAVEGEIEEIEIQGSDPEGEPLIRSYLAPLLRDKRITLARLEHALLIAQDLEGVEAQTLMRPGSRDGLVKLAVKVSSDPVSFQVYYDNMNSKYAGPDRLIGTTQINNLFGRSDYMRLSLQKTFDTSELTSWSVLQGFMLGAGGTRLEFSYTESLTRPGEELQRFDFRGQAKIASAILLMPIERGRYYNLRAQFGLQHLDSKQTAFGGDQQMYHDRLNIFTTEASVDWQDDWLGGGLSVLNLRYHQGLSNEAGHPKPSRAHARGRFGELEFFFNRFQSMTRRLSLQLAAGGQITSAPLVSSEQYSLGGYPFGRGFDMSAVAGDEGLAAKAELRYDISDLFGHDTSSLVRQLSLFGFYDTGKVWGDYSDAVSVSSSGLGLRGALDPAPMHNIHKRSLDFEVFMAWKQHAPDHLDDDVPVVRGRLILNF